MRYVLVKRYHNEVIKSLRQFVMAAAGGEFVSWPLEGCRIDHLGILALDR